MLAAAYAGDVMEVESETATTASSVEHASTKVIQLMRIV